MSAVLHPSAIALSTARSTAPASSSSPREWRRSSAALSTRPDGVRDPFSRDVGRGPVYRLVQAGAGVPDRGGREEPHRPREERNASSVSMSPNMFSVTITSNPAGCEMSRIAAVSTSMFFSVTPGNSRAMPAAVGPPEARRLEDVRLVHRRDFFLLPHGEAEREHEDPARISNS